MKNVFILLCFTILCEIGVAQSARERFSFQGVARDAAGKALLNSNVSLRISIHPFLNPVVYQETHKVLTSNAGIFTVLIGDGQAVSGAFSNISWETGNYFLQVEIDPHGGDKFYRSWFDTYYKCSICKSRLSVGQVEK